MKDSLGTNISYLLDITTNTIYGLWNWVISADSITTYLVMNDRGGTSCMNSYQHTFIYVQKIY